MFGLIVWVVFGLVAGMVAEWVFPPKAKHSKLHTILLGIAGSVAGGLAGAVVTGSSYQPAGFVLSVAGAIACQYAWNKYNEVE